MKTDNTKVFNEAFKVAKTIEAKMMMEIFESICQRAINVAVEKHSFDNQTFNLENSFSYAIYNNGRMVKFKSEGSGEGAAEARSFCESFVTPFRAQFSWSAVVVAGADYGAAIEGYIRRTEGERSKAGDVLTVLSDSFNFVSLEWIRDIKRHATA